MLMTQQKAGLSLAVTHMLTQRKLIHCEFWTIFISVHDNKPRPKYWCDVENTNLMWLLDENEKHGRDVDANVLLIGFADVHNP